MSKTFILQPSQRKNKKWMITTPEGKKIHFGAKGYQDYTEHQDPKRKDLYILRHSATGTEQWCTPNTAGFFSRWLLWNLPSLEASIRDTEKRFKINILLAGVK